MTKSSGIVDEKALLKATSHYMEKTQWTHAQKLNVCTDSFLVLGGGSN